jgi:hypothetical protein
MSQIRGYEKQIEQLLDEKIQKIFSLQDRWGDEKEYENFNDYKKIVSAIFKDYGFEGVELLKTFKINFSYQGKKHFIKIFKSGKVERTVEEKN